MTKVSCQIVFAFFLVMSISIKPVYSGCEESGLIQVDMTQDGNVKNYAYVSEENLEEFFESEYKLITSGVKPKNSNKRYKLFINDWNKTDLKNHKKQISSPIN